MVFKASKILKVLNNGHPAWTFCTVEICGNFMVKLCLCGEMVCCHGNNASVQSNHLNSPILVAESTELSVQGHDW